MCHLSTEFLFENRWSSFFLLSPSNRQTNNLTNADENKPSLAGVTMKTFNTVGKLGCVRACRKGYFPAQGDYAGVRPG